MADIDIVDRLTGTRWHGTPFGQDAIEAAAEIKRLRAENERLTESILTDQEAQEYAAKEADWRASDS